MNPLTNVPALMGIDYTSHDKLLAWAKQVQTEMDTTPNVVLSDESLHRIADEMRRQTEGRADFGDSSSYDNIFDFTITMQGVDIFVAYSYHAEGYVWENHHREWGQSEKGQELTSETVSDILIMPNECTCEMVADEKKLIQYFNKPLNSYVKR